MQSRWLVTGRALVVRFIEHSLSKGTAMADIDITGFFGSEHFRDKESTAGATRPSFAPSWSRVPLAGHPLGPVVVRSNPIQRPYRQTVNER
jgi:hypothetical protein